MAKRHSEEFRREAVRRMKESDNIVALAKELGVGRRRLYKWKEQQEGSGPEEIAAAVQTYISKLEQENNRLKRMMADKALEVDFFKGALQKVEARRQKESGNGEPTSTIRSEK